MMSLCVKMVSMRAILLNNLQLPGRAIDVYICMYVCV